MSARTLAEASAELEAARARVLKLSRECRALLREANPEWAQRRSEQFRELAARRRRALPPMTPDQKRLYDKIRNGSRAPRAEVLKIIGVTQ